MRNSLPKFCTIVLLAALSFAVSWGAPAISAAPVAPKTVRVWEVLQSSNWGKSTVKACAEGIRIEAHTGAVLVAKPPTWEVVIYRKGQKKAARTPYATFIKKYPHNQRAETFRFPKRAVKIAGASAVQYIMPLNRKLDATDGFGHSFQAKLETPYVSNMYVANAADSYVFPPQVKEIWRTYFEFAFIEKIPLEYYLELGDGSKRYSFQTLAQKYTNVPVTDFEHPKGLDYSAEFMQMVYGQKMEDVADLLMSP